TPQVSPSEKGCSAGAGFAATSAVSNRLSPGATCTIGLEKTNTPPGNSAGKGARVSKNGLEASAAAKAAPPAAPPPGAAATVLPWPGLVDREHPPVGLLAVQGGDGGLGLLVATHLDEAEALGAARVPAQDDLGRLHAAVRRKQALQTAVGRFIRDR